MEEGVWSEVVVRMHRELAESVVRLLPASSKQMV